MDGYATIKAGKWMLVGTEVQMNMVGLWQCMIPGMRKLADMDGKLSVMMKIILNIVMIWKEELDIGGDMNSNKRTLL